MCRSPELGGVRRPGSTAAHAPYVCCCPGPRPEHELNEHGSPLSQALSLGTTVAQTPTPQKTPLPQTPDTPYEIPPLRRAQSKVEKDPVHPWAGTPKRTEPTTSDRGVKDPKPGNRASYPHVVE